LLSAYGAAAPTVRAWWPDIERRLKEIMKSTDKWRAQVANLRDLSEARRPGRASRAPSRSGAFPFLKDVPCGAEPEDRQGS